MKIKLELEDFEFATTDWEFGTLRWLIVKVGGKKFNVRRSLGRADLWEDVERRNEEIDRYLINQMGHILGQILEDACAAIPDGTEILPRQETIHGN
jgi:hypothetical protein